MITKITTKQYAYDGKPIIYGLTLETLEQWFIDNGEKKFRASQVWDWLYRKRVSCFSEMSNLSKVLIEKLENAFDFPILTEKVKQQSVDGTIKFLFELKDELLIETVLMPQEYGLSVCVTTQVGCNIGCTFCASGIIAKQRDLTAGEIVAQIMHVQKTLDSLNKDERVSHVVVMGIGEPFDNYENLLKFLAIINSDKGLAIGARHITVSTSGLAPKIIEFANNGLQVNLALSLHAPNNETRSKIMKINRKYPIEVVMAAIDTYLAKTNRRVTFEYIMLNEVNDSVEHAHQLVALLKNKKHLAYVNLIPYNKVQEHDQYERSTKERVVAFYDVLKKNKINANVRKEFGHDIQAACGQLRSSEMAKDKMKQARLAQNKAHLSKIEINVFEK